MKYAAMTGFAFGPDDAVVQFDDALADGQSQAQAVDFSCEPCIDAVEMIEDALQLLY